MAIILIAGEFLRLVGIGRIGFNSDEAVYASQGASIAGLDQYKNLFPVFRAHPLLFQTMLSLVFAGGINDVAARTLAAFFGVATIGVTYLIGSRMYGHRAGLLAAAILAVMPYHVIVTRQVLLDGPMVFFATATLYCAVRFAQDRASSRWLFATMATMGLTFLTKETSILLLVGFLTYVFISPRPSSSTGTGLAARVAYIRTVRTHPQAVVVSALKQSPAGFRRRYLTTRTATIVAAGGLLLAMMAVLPLSILFSGRRSTGQNYLAYQLFRRSNHSLTFYATEVPVAIGLLVVVFALVAIIGLMVRAVQHQPVHATEKLLMCWAAVPIVGFELYPVKGFQYLLPVAPVAAVFAAQQILRLPSISLKRARISRPVVHLVVATIVLLSLVWPTWQRISPTPGTTIVAGSGGIPQGREAGTFVAENLPEGAELLTIGPSMANIIMYYSHRRAWGLSVSPNPLNRNPSYTALTNPDASLRQGEIQYIVWDAYSASRSPHFSEELMAYVKKFKATLIRYFDVAAQHNNRTSATVIKIYEVRIP